MLAWATTERRLPVFLRQKMKTLLRPLMERVPILTVLGTFVVSYGNPFRDQPLVLDQFFATGMAARKAARSPELQRFFGKAAGKIAAYNKPSAQPGDQ